MDDLGRAAPALTRRGALAGLAGLGPGAAAGSIAPPAYAAVGLPPVDKVWEWQQRLVDFGTRYTGSPGTTTSSSGWQRASRPSQVSSCARTG